MPGKINQCPVLLLNLRREPFLKCFAYILKRGVPPHQKFDVGVGKGAALLADQHLADGVRIALRETPGYLPAASFSYLATPITTA